MMHPTNKESSENSIVALSKIYKYLLNLLIILVYLILYVHSYSLSDPNYMVKLLFPLRPSSILGLLGDLCFVYLHIVISYIKMN